MKKTMNRERITLTALLLLVVSSMALGGIFTKAAPDQRPADISIDQPDYVGTTVGTTEEANRTIYNVKGNNFEIRTNNFDHANVSSTSIDADTASFRYNDQRDHYEFSPNKNDGSYRVTWTVNEQEQIQIQRNNATVTETRDVKTDYVAIIQVRESNVTHVPESEYQETQTQAENWEDFTGEIEDIVGEGVDIEAQVQSALEFIRFKNNPLSFLSGGIVGALLTLTTTPGGLFLLGIIVLINLVVAGGAIVGYNKYRTLSGAEAEIDEKVDYVVLKQMKQSLTAVDVEDVFASDWVAERWRRDLGADNLWDAFTVVIALFDSSRIVKQKLQAMDAEGYTAEVERDEDGEVSSIAFSEDGDIGKNAWKLADEDDVIRFLVDDAPDAFDSFSMRNIDLSEYPDIDLDVRSSLDDVLDQLDNRVARRSDDKKQRAREINQILQNVRKHEYTDDDGNPIALRTAVNMLLRIQNEAGDRGGFPNVSRLQDYNYFLLNNYDRDSPDLGGDTDD